MTVPQDLIERVRKAPGPDRELDRDIHAEMYGWEKIWNEGLEFFQLWKDGKWIALGSIPAYTGSTDADLALVETVLPGWHWNIGHDANGELHATIWHGVNEFDEYAPTAPLAIILAVLTALQSSEQSK